MTKPNSAKLFHTPLPQGRKKQAIVEQAMARFPKVLRNKNIAQDFLSHSFTPASKQWVYKGNGKSGTTSTKKFLFLLEFGVPLSTHLKVTTDINPDVAAHRLGQSGVLRKLIHIDNGIDLLDNALTLTTVRHPTKRAVSAFHYLCQSHEQAHVWFASDRLRMNAAVSFDWDTDTHTAKGLEKFLDYIALEQDQGPTYAINPHWRPQTANVLPQILRPDLIGRTENLKQFYQDIADRLDSPLPTDWDMPHANKAVFSQPWPDILTPACMTRIRDVYAADFERFDYEP